MKQEFFVSDVIPAVPRIRNLSEFRSEPFRGRVKCWGFPYCGTKIEANFRNLVPEHFAEEKQHGISFRGTKIEANFQKFVPTHFAKELTLPFEDLGMSSFFRRIRKVLPSTLLEIFSGEENYLPILAGRLEDKSDRKKYFLLYLFLSNFPVCI
jgi:hypothetical protein